MIYKIAVMGKYVKKKLSNDTKMYHRSMIIFAVGTWPGHLPTNLEQCWRKWWLDSWEQISVTMKQKSSFCIQDGAFKCESDKYQQLCWGNNVTDLTCMCDGMSRIGYITSVVAPCQLLVTASQVSSYPKSRHEGRSSAFRAMTSAPSCWA